MARATNAGRAGVMFGCLIFLAIISCTVCVITMVGDGDSSEPQISRETSRPQLQTRSRSLSDADIAQTMEAYPDVLDAAISRRGSEVSLVLIVPMGTTEAKAREMGENFVRMYKSMSDDDPPGQSIGTGKYDYLIGVYDPNETPMAIGAKIDIMDRITW